MVEIQGDAEQQDITPMACDPEPCSDRFPSKTFSSAKESPPDAKSAVRILLIRLLRTVDLLGAE
jgi:hypothetical protein